MGLVLNSDQIRLKCDGPGCAVVVALNVQSAHEALWKAEKLGWEIDPITTDGLDHLIYCPECRQKHKELCKMKIVKSGEVPEIQGIPEGGLRP